MADIRFGRRRVPLPRSRPVRVGVGAGLILGGVLGFLPVLGFWMLPLGVIVLSVDSPAMRRLRRRRGLRCRHGAAVEKQHRWQEQLGCGKHHGEPESRLWIVMPDKPLCNAFSFTWAPGLEQTDTCLENHRFGADLPAGPTLAFAINNGICRPCLSE